MAFVGVKEVPTGLHSKDPTYFNSVGLGSPVGHGTQFKSVTNA
jgi:hypothetical protein